jgi:cell wall-associated NlpC family hydrolase
MAFGRDVLGKGNSDSELLCMVKVGTPQPGDLAFFGYRSGSVYVTHHVGVYIGNGMMINERATGNYVEKTPISHFTDLVGYWHLNS